MNKVKSREYFILALAVLLLLGIGVWIVIDAQKSPDAPNAQNVQDSPSVPNAQPPSMMIDHVLYYSTGLVVSVDADESEYLGKITSVVSISEIPKSDGQANIPFEDAPYVEYEEGLALLMDKGWVLFEVREED